MTDKGLRVALWFTRCHARLFRPALGELFAEKFPETARCAARSKDSIRR